MQPLSLHEVKEIVKESKANNSPSNVIKRIGSVFGTSAILNISFLKVCNNSLPFLNLILGQRRQQST